MADEILVEVDGAVGVVTLNRPDVGNALTASMIDRLGSACAELDASDEVRAIVITGAGRMFCSGTDLSQRDTTWSEPDEWDDREYFPLRSLATPVIAAVNGAAVGAGLAAAVACDLRIVAEDAKLGFVFVRRGIIADNDLHWWLPRLIGTTQAMDLLLTGRIFSGREAVALGLANRCLPSVEVLPAAIALAQDIASNCAPLAVAVSKSLAYRALDEPLADSHRQEWGAFGWMGRQPDSGEGAASFMERRPAVWPSSKHRRSELPDPN